MKGVTFLIEKLVTTTYKKLGINLTQEPVYQTSRLYHK